MAIGSYNVSLKVRGETSILYFEIVAGKRSSFVSTEHRNRLSFEFEECLALGQSEVSDQTTEIRARLAVQKEARRPAIDLFALFEHGKFPSTTTDSDGIRDLIYLFNVAGSLRICLPSRSNRGNTYTVVYGRSSPGRLDI